MGYSGYKDKDSSNILNKYHFIKESKSFYKQNLNEAAVLAAPILWQILAAAGITGGLMVTLQKAFPPEVVKQIEDAFSNIINQFNSLSSAASAASVITSLNTIASMVTPISKPLGLVYSGLSKLVTDTENGSITEEQAATTYKTLVDQYYKAAYSSLSQVQYSNNDVIATLQKQIVRYITADMAKSQDEEVKKAQAWKENLKRNTSQTGPGQPQEPQKPDDKDPWYKRWGKKDSNDPWYKKISKWCWRHKFTTCFILFLIWPKITAIFSTAFNTIINLPVVKAALAAANYLSIATTGMPASELVKKGAVGAGNWAIGSSEGEPWDIYGANRAAEMAGVGIPSPKDIEAKSKSASEEYDQKFPNYSKPRSR